MAQAKRPSSVRLPPQACAAALAAKRRPLGRLRTAAALIASFGGTVGDRKRRACLNAHPGANQAVQAARTCGTCRGVGEHPVHTANCRSTTKAAHLALINGDTRQRQRVAVVTRIGIRLPEHHGRADPASRYPPTWVTGTGLPVNASPQRGALAVEERPRHRGFRADAVGNRNASRAHPRGHITRRRPSSKVAASRKQERSSRRGTGPVSTPVPGREASQLSSVGGWNQRQFRDPPTVDSRPAGTIASPRVHSRAPDESNCGPIDRLVEHRQVPAVVTRSQLARPWPGSRRGTSSPVTSRSPPPRSIAGSRTVGQAA